MGFTDVNARPPRRIPDANAAIRPMMVSALPGGL